MPTLVGDRVIPHGTVNGVGDCFAKIVAPLGWLARPGCDCESVQAQMNALGPAGCMKYLPLLVGAVQKNARIPLPSAVVKVAILRAIKMTQGGEDA